MTAQLRFRSRMGIAVATALAAGALATPLRADAAGTLDQSQPSFAPGYSGVCDTQDQAQTFTAGITGQLDQVDLAIARRGAAGNLTVQIRPVSGGTPAAITVLASATVLEGSVPNNQPLAFVSVPLSPTAPSMAGLQYAITLLAPGGSCVNNVFWAWGLDNTNPYADGSEYFSSDGTSWTNSSATDQAFKTYVSPVPSAQVPEVSGGFLLLLFGLIAVAGAATVRRVRRRPDRVPR